MEFAIYSFLFFILFLGILFNLKITNNKRVNEIKKGLKRNAKPGLYYDDVTDTYTRVGVNEDGRPFVEESNITIDTLIGG